MQPKKLVLFLPFIMLLPAVPLKDKNHKDSEAEIKQVVLKEYEGFKLLAPAYNLQLGSIVFSNETTHVSNGSLDVVMNADEIDRFTQGQSNAFKSMFVKFVIGHELGHKVQFNSYRREVINKSRGEGTVFLECNADLLSGMMVSALNNNATSTAAATQMPLSATVQAQNLDLSLSVLRRILEMDRENTSVETHPRNIERLIAFRQGLLMGNCYLLHLVFTNNIAAFNQLPAGERERLKSLSMLLDKELGYDPVNANNPIIWCHAEAIRIIHENNSVVRNLIRYEEKIDWDPNPNHSVVNFSFRVFNRNSNSVQFNGRVFTEIIPRNDPENVLRIGANDSYSVQVTIPAGESVLISGQLNWVADDSYMPQIVIPGDKRSLYWAFDMVNPLPDMSPVTGFDANFSKWNNSTPDNIADLISNVVLLRGKLFENCRGMGISEFSDQELALNSKLTYEPLFKSGIEDDQKIYIYNSDQKRNYYRFTAFTSLDTITANRRFVLLINAIMSALPQFKLGHDIMLSNTRTLAFRKDGQSSVRMVMDYGKNGKPTETHIVIINR